MGMPMFGERPLKELSDDQLLDWITYYIGFSEWVKDSGSFDTGVSPTMYHINEELELRDLTRPDPRLFDPAKDRDPGALSTGRTTQFNVPHDPNRVESEGERARRLYDEKVLPYPDVDLLPLLDRFQEAIDRVGDDINRQAVVWTFKEHPNGSCRAGYVYSYWKYLNGDEQWNWSQLYLATDGQVHNDGVSEFPSQEIRTPFRESERVRMHAVEVIEYPYQGHGYQGPFRRGT